MKAVPLLLTVLALLSTSAAKDSIYIAAVETKALEAKEGQKVTVYGSTKGSEKSPSGTNFVNFEEADFYLVTFKSDLKSFPDGEPVDLFEGKRLAVTGTISIYRGKPQIKLTSAEQVEILEEDRVFPPEVEKADTEEPTPALQKETEKPTGETKPAKPKPPVDPSLYFKD